MIEGTLAQSSGVEAAQAQPSLDDMIVTQIAGIATNAREYDYDDGGSDASRTSLFKTITLSSLL